VYGAGMLLFGASAYFYRMGVKYMVKIGTPVPNGYQVKTLCTHGPFQYFQHPIYAALLGCSLATPLVLDSACIQSPPHHSFVSFSCPTHSSTHIVCPLPCSSTHSLLLSLSSLLLLRLPAALLVWVRGALDSEGVKQ